MSWSRKLPKRLRLADGRTLITLADARDLLLDLSRLDRDDPQWRNAGDLLLQAAHRNRQNPILDAGERFSRALEANGLLRPSSSRTAHMR
jgi:hypothetical protein